MNKGVKANENPFPLKSIGRQERKFLRIRKERPAGGRALGISCNLAFSLEGKRDSSHQVLTVELWVLSLFVMQGLRHGGSRVKMVHSGVEEKNCYDEHSRQSCDRNMMAFASDH
jgi:hypothetical protein